MAAKKKHRLLPFIFLPLLLISCSEEEYIEQIPLFRIVNNTQQNLSLEYSGKRYDIHAQQELIFQTDEWIWESSNYSYLTLGHASASNLINPSIIYHTDSIFFVLEDSTRVTHTHEYNMFLPSIHNIFDHKSYYKVFHFVEGVYYITYSLTDYDIDYAQGK